MIRHNRLLVAFHVLSDVLLGLTAFIVAYTLGQNFSALVMAALLGAVLAFLFYNFNPARIFMGDSGSMLIGLLLASSTITLTGRVSYGGLFTTERPSLRRGFAAAIATRSPVCGSPGSRSDGRAVRSRSRTWRPRAASAARASRECSGCASVRSRG